MLARYTNIRDPFLVIIPFIQALASELSCEGMEVCRRCMGGHGFLMATGITDLYTNWLPSRTYEGEHTVLLLVRVFESQMFF